MTDKYFRQQIAVLAVLLLLLGTEYTAGQTDKVSPLSKSTLNPLQTELFVYAAGGTGKHANLWTAISNDRVDIYETFIDAGLQTELAFQKKKWFRLGASLGYKNEVYSDKRTLSGRSGVYTHWLTFDVTSTIYSYMIVGLRSDVFLASKIRNTDHFSFEGLYSDCFNRFSLVYYIGGSLRLSNFKLEGRMGSYLRPQLSHEKISYHNMHKTYVEGGYFEIRVSYRLFTTGKVQESPFFDY